MTSKQDKGESKSISCRQNKGVLSGIKCEQNSSLSVLLANETVAINIFVWF